MKWPTSKGDVVSLGGSLFRRLKLTHLGLMTTVKVIRLGNPMIAATALVVFFIHRLFQEALWVGYFLILLKLALKFLLLTLALGKFSFKSAVWLIIVHVLIVVHLHHTWRRNLVHDLLELSIGWLDALFVTF